MDSSLSVPWSPGHLGTDTLGKLSTSCWGQEGFYNRNGISTEPHCRDCKHKTPPRATKASYKAHSIINVDMLICI